jgi:hypothetical protein
MLTTLMNNQVKGSRWHALPSMQRRSNADFADRGDQPEDFRIRFAQSLGHDRTESRMRENRPYGSEGGGTEINRSSLPLSLPGRSRPNRTRFREGSVFSS